MFLNGRLRVIQVGVSMVVVVVMIAAAAVQWIVQAIVDVVGRKGVVVVSLRVGGKKLGRVLL